ncbi:MAG: hypothetical protein AAF492_12320, partial [Verrucomicrobiota bacterium]
MGSRKATVRLPDTPKQAFDFFSRDGHAVTPSANILRVATGPNLLEVEPNDTSDDVAEGDRYVPLALNGVIEKPNDIDWFRFKAKAGKRYKVKTWGRSLGSAINPKITVESAPGAKKSKRLSNDDVRGSELNLVYVSRTIKDMFDPILLFEPPHDGEYAIKVEDVHGVGGPTFVYRVEIEEAEPLLLTSISGVNRGGRSHQMRNRISLSRGNRANTIVAVQKGFATKFDGALELKAVGLPPGVDMHAPRIEAGQDRVAVVFTATDEADLGAALIELQAVPVDASQPLNSRFSQTVGFYENQNNLMYQTFVDRLAISVSEKAPYSITVTEPEIPLLKYSEIPIKVAIEREPGFDSPIELNLDLLPPGVVRPTPLKIKPDQTEVEYIVSGRNLVPGSYQVSLS